MTNLTPSATAEVEECARSAVAEHAGDRGPLMPILHTIQERLGCVPPEVEPLLAELLNLSKADVRGVVSFYHDFRRKAAEHTVRVCRAEACQSIGGQELYEYAEQSLGLPGGGVSEDGKVRLNEVFCLGNCALGPSAMVDGRIHGRVSPARLDALMGEIS